jgi:glycosyltransferase involved in cell wall biosynthesis/ubiquinone/menaquinone biosynthesis C-methylase UbiE
MEKISGMISSNGKPRIRRPKVIFLGPLPPPFMGPTVATEIILRSKIIEEFELVHLDTSDHRELNHLGALDLKNVALALSHYLELFRMILRKKPGLVYVPISQTTIGFIRDSGYIIISKLLRRKVICHLRGSNFSNWVQKSPSLNQVFVKFVLKRTQGVIVLGHKLKFIFEEYFDNERIFVVPNGADFNVSHRSFSKSDRVKLLFLGHLHSSKGIEDVIEAISIMQDFKDGKPVELDIVGNWLDEDCRERCLAKIGEKKLPVNIKHSLSGKAKFDVYAGADVFIFPPRGAEGHPWVIIEAMASGLPIISTDQGAITESVIEGQNGYIVAPCSPGEIAERVMRLAGNFELLKSMGKKSRQLYEINFTEAVMVEQLGYSFTKILKAGGQKKERENLFNDWSDKYKLRNKHFLRRMENVHQLMDDLEEDSLVLDVGCATGEIIHSINRRYNCRSLGIDLSPKMVEHCRGKYQEEDLEFQEGDILNLNFPEDSFDTVLSLSVIEWLDDLEDAIREVSKVLKKNGQWIVSIPNWKSPFRKVEFLISCFYRGSYLRHQGNRIPVPDFIASTKIRGFVMEKALYHVMPLYSNNFKGKLGPYLGMMCILSLRKSSSGVLEVN